MAEKRINIGLLINEYCDVFANEVCEGAMRAAEEMDANLYVLAGGYFDAPYMARYNVKYECQNNYIYRYINKENIDVLIVLLGTIASNVDRRIQEDFLKSYQGIPLITIANKVDGYANISYDNKKGFEKEVEYLIETLGKKEIGIVCGPPTNEDSCERVAAYKEVLQRHNMPVYDRRIVWGNFCEYSDDVVEELLDHNPELDAIIFANDHMAVGGYRVLKKRGLEIGKDIAVTGFDDSPFASRMEPPLTTTRADSAGLGYRAVQEVCRLKVGEEKDIRIETKFIVRESCGSRIRNKQAGIEERYDFMPGRDDADGLVQQICNTLTSGFAKGENLQTIAREVGDYTAWMMANLYGRHIDDALAGEMTRRLIGMNDNVIGILKSPERIYEVNEYFAMLLAEEAPDEGDRARIYMMLAEGYKNSFLYSEKLRAQSDKHHELLNGLTVSMSRDMIGEGKKTDNYEALLSRLGELGFKSSYILLHPEAVYYAQNDSWKKPAKMLLAVSQKGDRCIVPKEKEQEFTLADIFRNPLIEDGGRKTYAASMLFSGKEQYGLFVAELTQENILDVEPIVFQISSVFNTLHLIRGKEAVSAQLAESLQKLRETNAFLDEVSKSDELTRIYNRRGFLVAVKHQMKDRKNFGRKAVMIYADMNNLKLINDKFGHEEGDYSLKAITAMLKEALGEKEIIARFGGDEFAAFLFTEEKDYERIIRDRINAATVRANADNDKPYYISMSVGISSFVVDETAELDEAIVRADVDLYLQKKHKRSKIMK